jgi:Cu/Ag efflux protein CusF
MTLRSLFVSLLLALPAMAAPANCGCECCKGKDTCCCAASETAVKADAPRYPLKGVVVDVVPERHALLVKHEEIPDVMRAMTMLLKVGPAPLREAKKGQALTGQLTRREDGWWLEDVELADR